MKPFLKKYWHVLVLLSFALLAAAYAPADIRAYGDYANLKIAGVFAGLALLDFALTKKYG